MRVPVHRDSQETHRSVAHAAGEARATTLGR
jgi:hypothetical protein